MQRSLPIGSSEFRLFIRMADSPEWRNSHFQPWLKLTLSPGCHAGVCSLDRRFYRPERNVILIRSMNPPYPCDSRSKETIDLILSSRKITVEGVFRTPLMSLLKQHGRLLKYSCQPWLCLRLMRSLCAKKLRAFFFTPSAIMLMLKVLSRPVFRTYVFTQ